MVGEHLIYVMLSILLLCATVTDLRERLIYDRFILIGLLLSAVIHLYDKQYTWWEYVLTSLGAFFVLAMIAVITKGSAIGGGDIKLFALIGFAIGLEGFTLVFIISHLSAALFILLVKLIRWQSVRKETEIPFAPFILLGVLSTYGLLCL